MTYIPKPPGPNGLYDPSREHDACGVGFVCDLKGRQTNELVRDAIQVLLNLEHRGACGCEAETGDGAGLLIQLPHEFLRKASDAAKIRLPEAGAYGVGMFFLPKDKAGRDCFVAWCFGWTLFPLIFFGMLPSVYSRSTPEPHPPYIIPKGKQKSIFKSSPAMWV